MTERWLDTVPVLGEFSDGLDPARYEPLPDDWNIGVADIVDSTSAIENGRYKAVNLVGAGVITAVSNALDGELRLFTFGGDGARIAVPPDQAERTADALSRVAKWADRDLNLSLRMGMISVADIRAAGWDVRAAFWRPSGHVGYAMFSGGGLEFAESMLKQDALKLPATVNDGDPDLTGLSCQWGAIQSRHGAILSLIVKPVEGAPDASFASIASGVVRVIEESASGNPVPEQGPEVKWPGKAIKLQSRVAPKGVTGRVRYLRALLEAFLSWFVFKTGLPVGKFKPARYRREIAENTDFRKFDDGLIMTIDCSLTTVDQLRDILDKAVKDNIVRYGMHVQEEALLTCIAPAVMASDHIHFVDGADGGYGAAARQLRERN